MKTKLVALPETAAAAFDGLARTDNVVRKGSTTEREERRKAIKHVFATGKPYLPLINKWAQDY